MAARITVNITTSMPRGLYWLRPEAPLNRDTTVCLSVPRPVRSLVDSRRYLPPSFRLLKRIVAMPGDRVCTEGNLYVVDDTLISAIATHDHLGRRLDTYPFCGIVPSGAAFLAARGDSSLDSRYFGPVPLSDLTPAVPIWTFF